MNRQSMTRARVARAALLGGLLAAAACDPNKALDSLKLKGEITALGPNFTAPTAPFGKWISLDGVHPSAEGQKIIANGLIGVINAKYGTTLKPIP